MNPYINSLNGFGGGFIAFWPNQGGVIPPPPVGEPAPTGRGSGPTTGIDGYRKTYDDDMLETRRKRILREDEELAALIVVMITRDLL